MKDEFLFSSACLAVISCYPMFNLNKKSIKISVRNSNSCKLSDNIDQLLSYNYTFKQIDNFVNLVYYHSISRMKTEHDYKTPTPQLTTTTPEQQLFTPLGNIHHLISLNIQQPQIPETYEPQMRIPFSNIAKNFPFLFDQYSAREQIILPVIKLDLSLSTPNEPSSQEKKSKLRKKSSEYHKVQNSRKIKAKKSQKQHLRRSQFFYQFDIQQRNQQSEIAKLLNDYQNLHSLILSGDWTKYQRKIIRLSHYGNSHKGKHQKSLNKSKELFKQSNKADTVLNKSVFVVQSRYRNKQEFPLSKSVLNHQNRSTGQQESLLICSSKRYGQTERIIKNDKIHYFGQKNYDQKDNILKDESLIQSQTKNPGKKTRKNPQNKNQHLMKYTTPVRAIYLNKKNNTSTSFLNKSTIINTNNISSSPQNSPNYSVEKKFQQSSISMINQKNINKKQNEEDNLSSKRSHGQRRLRKSKSYGKIGIKVISAKKFNQLQQNFNQSDKFHNFRQNLNFNQLENKKNSLTNSYPISQYPNFSSKYRFKATQSHFLHTPVQQKNHSNSRKGLSLTSSSAKQLKNPILLYNKSSSKLNSKPTLQKDKQLIQKKLNNSQIHLTKRVQIRIY